MGSRRPKQAQTFPKIPSWEKSEMTLANTGTTRAWLRLPTGLVYHLCDGFADLQLALRPFVVDRLPAVSGHGGSRRGATVQVDIVNLKGGGNGEEYLLRRLKKHDAEHHADFAGKWSRGEYGSVRKAAIAAGIVQVPEA